MDPKSNLRIKLFLLTIHSLSFLCQSKPNDPTCGQPFKCANIPNITYPFWNTASTRKDNSSLVLCGNPSFGLDCQGAAPILNISRLPYRVLEISFYNYSLKVARQDLWSSACHAFPVNTTLNSNFFRIIETDHRSVTLYYNCSGGDRSTTLPNQFTCGTNETMNLFTTGTAVADFSCKQRFTVPVSKSAEQALGTSLGMDALHAGLASGFWIEWSADNQNCTECWRLGGACAYDRNSSKFFCSMMSRQRRGNPRDDSFCGNCKKVGLDCAYNWTSNEFFCNRSLGDATGYHKQPPAMILNGSASHHRKGINVTNFNKFNRRRIELGLEYGVLGGFTLAFILISWCSIKRYFRRGPTNQKVEKFLLEQGSLSPKRYKYSEIKKLTKSFSDKLGQGGYGSVYKGALSDDHPIAVKVLIETDSNDEEFINEVASISKTSHVNIVSLLGFCYEGSKRALVYEYMPNKSLDKFIRDTKASLDVETLFKIALGVAKGLEYLHRGCNTKIIHFDIKPQNILLDEGFCPKISDFGLAKLCKKKTSILSVLGARGTIGYIAPEVFSRNFGGVSHKSDVYSYGIMLLEMAGARTFTEAETVQMSENYFPDRIYEQVVLGHGMHILGCNEFIVELEDERARKMFLVGFWCIQTMPVDRPSMSKVVEILEGNLDSIPIPPKPFLFNPKLFKQGFSPSLSTHVETNG